MARYAQSDEEDWPVWQANADDLGKLLDAEKEHRRGRAPDWYRELLQSFGGPDRLSAGTTGSSLSKLSDTQAFERGYRGR